MKKSLMIPPMKCDSGCGDCCGPAPATETEYQKVLHVARVNKIVPKAQGETCPFYQEGSCKVYAARPLSCRLFGHVPAMTCSRGYNVNVPDAVARRLIFRNGMPRRVLHEALVDLGVVKTLDEAFHGVNMGTKPEDPLDEEKEAAKNIVSV